MTETSGISLPRLRELLAEVEGTIVEADREMAEWADVRGSGLKLAAEIERMMPLARRELRLTREFDRRVERIVWLTGVERADARRIALGEVHALAYSERQAMAYRGQPRSARELAALLFSDERRALELTGSSNVIDRCTPKWLQVSLAEWGLLVGGGFGLSELGMAVRQIVQDEQLDRLGLGR